jgi:hypothetical protein
VTVTCTPECRICVLFCSREKTRLRQQHFTWSTRCRPSLFPVRHIRKCAVGPSSSGVSVQPAVIEGPNVSVRPPLTSAGMWWPQPPTRISTEWNRALWHSQQAPLQCAMLASKGRDVRVRCMYCKSLCTVEIALLAVPECERKTTSASRGAHGTTWHDTPRREKPVSGTISALNTPGERLPK